MKELAELLKNAEYKQIATGSSLNVPDDEVWWILYGEFNHTTGTISEFHVYMGPDAQAKNKALHSAAASASNSGTYPLFPTVAGAPYAQNPAFCIVPSGSKLSFNGGTGSSVTICITKIKV